MKAFQKMEKFTNILEAISPNFFAAVRRRWRLRRSTRFNVFGVSELEKKRVAISYMTLPFEGAVDPNKWENASNFWCNYEMALAFHERGYVVDAIDCFAKETHLLKTYNVFIENGVNLDRCAGQLPEDCVKIRYATGQHWLVRNSAELERLNRVRSEKGVVIPPKRALKPYRSDLLSDYLIHIGNRHMRSSYSHISVPAFSISIPGVERFDYIATRDWRSARKNFMWLGSGGMVHKGLDLVLEVFRDLPELDLHVVGPVDKEPEFYAAYQAELEECRNIHIYGFLNMKDQAFYELAGVCGGLVFPSCSEGTGNVNIVAMSLGLIPIISKECCLDVGDGGVELQNCTVEEIRDEVVKVSAMGVEELKERSKLVRSSAEENHTRDSYSKRIREILDKIGL